MESYTLTTYSLMPNIIEKPMKQLEELNHKIDKIGYWINPVNWVKEAWAALHEVISTGSWDVPLICATMVCVILIGLGANFLKKWVFWGWVIFWILRGFVFV